MASGTIHVLHVLNSAHGGSAISTLELISALSEQGIQSSLVCFNNASSAVRDQISSAVGGRVMFLPLYCMNKRIRTSPLKRPIVECINWWRTFGGHRYQPEIASFIRDKGITVVHTSTILNPEGAIAARANNIPHVWHVRELVGPNLYFQFHNYPKWARFVSSHSDILVANSRLTKHCLRRYFPDSLIRVIPNGIRVDSFKKVSHSTSNGKTIVIGMIGSLTSRVKNHSFFINVALRFLRRNDIQFRIYGTIPSDNDDYYSKIKAMIRQYKLTNLQLVPFASPQQIMTEIDVLFHPAEFESFGRIFIEAMAAGIPVIGVDTSGAIEMVQNGVNGYLVANNDVDTIEKYLGALADDPNLREEFGNRGRSLVESKYSIQTLSDSIGHLYMEVVQGRLVDSSGTGTGTR